MNRKITADDFHDSVERQLSGLKPDPWLAQRIIASEKGEVEVKKVSSALLIIIALIILAMATTLAAGLGRNVNWFGEEPQETDEPEVIEEEEESEVTEEEEEPEIIHEPVYFELPNNAKDRELIVISKGNDSTSTTRTQKISNEEEFLALMAATPDFPLPVKVPEGYVFDHAIVEFGCQPQGYYMLTSQTETPEGYTESHYAVDPSMDFVRDYYLLFRNEDGTARFHVHVSMSLPEDPYEPFFTIEEDQTVRPVQIDGIENALFIESDEDKSLFMRKLMSEPQSDLLYIGPNFLQLCTYSEYRIIVDAKQFTDSELIGVFVNN